MIITTKRNDNTGLDMVAGYVILGKVAEKKITLKEGEFRIEKAPEGFFVDFKKYCYRHGELILPDFPQ